MRSFHINTKINHQQHSVVTAAPSWSLNTLIMSAVTALIALIVFVLTFVPFIQWYRKRAKYVNIINKIPGPKALPLVGTSYLFAQVDRRHLFHHLNTIKNMYPIISRAWIGPLAAIELKRAEHIEKILGSGKHHLAKAWTYKFIKLWLGEGLLTSVGDKWQSHRKIITPTFHFSILENFCDTFAEKCEILVSKLAEHADTGNTFNVYPYVTRAALDIIADTAMGLDINAQNDTHNEYVQAVYESAELVVRRMTRPWKQFDCIYQYTEEGKRMKKYVNTLHTFTRDVIRERREIRKKISTESPPTLERLDSFNAGKKKRQAFLDLLLDTSGGHSFTDEELREEVDTFMFAGHDTTTTAISWVLFLLGTHPNIQEDVFAELDTIFEGNDRAATIHDLNEMKLLERVIKETLRIYPSVPLIGRTSSEDVQVDQYTIPSGTTIMIEIYHLHRDERYFPDPERFDPDRFLPENMVDRHSYAYLPFSAGARNCIGQKFGQLEMKAMVSAIVRQYRVKVDKKRADLDVIFELILRPIDGIPILLEKRTKK